MKKTLVTLCFSCAMLSLSAQANNEELRPFYVGVKSGWSSAHHGVSQFKSSNTGTSPVNRHALTFGVFAGYNINERVAAEWGYDYFGRMTVNSTDSVTSKPQFKHSAHGSQLSLKLNYPMAKNLNLFAKVGGAYVFNNYQFSANSGLSQRARKASKTNFSLLGGLGLDYKVASDLTFRVEYQYLNKVGKNLKVNRVKLKYQPDFHALSVGVVYNFGSARPKPVESNKLHINKNFEFDTDVLFDFGKADLKVGATQALDKVYQDISALNLNKAYVSVNGYSDRVGTDNFNQKLSQRRADNVAGYIINKGISPEFVTATGYGKKTPVTGNSCDAVKSRNALIQCLAPDRRVSVRVKGVK